MRKLSLSIGVSSKATIIDRFMYKTHDEWISLESIFSILPKAASAERKILRNLCHFFPQSASTKVFEFYVREAKKTSNSNGKATIFLFKNTQKQFHKKIHREKLFTRKTHSRSFINFFMRNKKRENSLEKLFLAKKAMPQAHHAQSSILKTKLRLTH